MTSERVLEIIGEVEKADASSSSFQSRNGIVDNFIHGFSSMFAPRQPIERYIAHRAPFEELLLRDRLMVDQSFRAWLKATCTSTTEELASNERPKQTPRLQRAAYASDDRPNYALAAA